MEAQRHPETAIQYENEDLEGFNGAGLYSSYTHGLDEGPLEKSVKQVWASLWNYRAFEEREFWRIDHFSAAMGVLVHPNYTDEQANGVGVTTNIFDPAWDGHYVNVQVGENLVTNPEAGTTPENTSSLSSEVLTKSNTSVSRIYFHVGRPSSQPGLDLSEDGPDP